MSISKCLFNKFWDPFHSQNALKIDQKSSTYQLKNKNNFLHPWGNVFFHFLSFELPFQNWKKCPKRGRGCIFHTSSMFNIQSLLKYFFTTLQYKNQAILMPKSFPNRFQSRWKTKPNFQFTFTTLFDEFGPSIWGPKAAENSQKCSRNVLAHPYWSISECNDDNEGHFGRILLRFWEAAGSNFLILQPIFHSELWKVFEALSIALESISGPKKGPSFASRERSKTLSRIPGGWKFWKILPKESVTSLLKHFGMQWW